MDLVENSKIMASRLKERLTNLEALEFVGKPNMSLLAITTTCVLTIVTGYYVLRRRALITNSKRPEKHIWSRETRAYRVSGVPLDWDRDRLRTFLKHRELAEVITIDSIAREANIESQTATVTLTNSYMQQRPGKSRQFSLSEEHYNDSLNLNRSVSVENNFIGLTTLYEPSVRDHKIDVIALSGLGGHAFGSFKERGGTHMWLRDSLPGYLTSETDNKPMARVMIYGYESAVPQSKNMQNLEDLATTFHSSLLALAAGPTTRPIILIGHSLGGLIIKQALISLSRSSIADDQKLIRAVYGVIFFGTPHDGMDISSLIPMVGDGPNRFLVESISRINSQIISIQQRDFHHALGKKGDSEVFCFYETLESPTAQLDKLDEWKMIGPTAVLVTKSSATHCRPWEDGSEHICAIARTHSDMVKFGPHDPDYRNVWMRIRGLSRRAIRARDRLQTTTSKFLVPYRQNPDFVGRSDILDKLKLQFGLGQQPEHELSQPRRRVSLYGLGGVGKTQIALAYAYWIRDIHPDISVFWVHASNADRFRAAYAFIAEKCSVPGRNNPEANILLLVKRWLEEQNKIQWLMIIDNVDDMELFFPSQRSDDPEAHQQGDKLARYLPDCNHGSILITTRNKQVGVKFDQGSPLIEVTKMTDDEAHQLVQGILKTEVSTHDTILLVSKLEHLPLALAQALAFIQENTISISDYIQLLDGGDNALVDQLSESFEPVGRDSETPHAVTAAWILSFRLIERTQPLASDVLCFLSLLHRQAIPKTFTEEHCYQQKPGYAQGSVSAGLIKALGTLKAFSFISEGKDGSVDMHRLVQLVTRKWLVNQGRLAEFTESAITFVSYIYPLGEFDTYQACVRYLPHVNSVLARDGTNSRAERIAKGGLLRKLARYYCHKGEWKNMEQNLRLAANIQAQELGEEHLETFIIRGELVLACQKQGMLNEAEDLALEILETGKRVLGKEHPDVLTCLASLSLIYERQGRFGEAEDLLVQVSEARKRVLGEDHLYTIETISSLTNIYLHQGRLKEAEISALRVTEMKKQKLGEDHPRTIAGMTTLASTYERQGRLKEAEDIGSHATNLSTRVLGEDHPQTLANKSNLAHVYMKQGRWKEADDLQMKLMETMRQIFGWRHPDTLTILNNLASSCLSQGRLTEAEHLGTQVLEVRKRVLGEKHPETCTSMSNLASIYGKQQRLEEARDLGIQSLELRKSTLGEEHPDTLLSKHNVAYDLEKLGRSSDAIALMEECVSARERILGGEHPDTMLSLSILEGWRRKTSST
ncbi:hypothetical protein V8C40DRAFT_252626 [Trichoderma camerunense]